MRASQRIAVIVPAFNEERLIESTLRGMPPWVDRIVVIDDASTDATAARAQDAARGDGRILLCRHAHNRGVGAALKTGYCAAAQDGADVIAVMAGDGQMDPADLPALLEPILSGAADYTKGNRLAHGAVRRAMPRARLIGNRTLSWLTRVALGVRVQDSQCGYTAISSGALAKIPIAALWEGYGYPNDLIARLAESGARLRDVTVRPVYASEISGIGLRHALGVIPFVIARACLRRVLPPVPGRARLSPASLEGK